MNRVICDWTTYKGSHCKRIISGNISGTISGTISGITNCVEDGDIQTKHLHRFCDIHKDLIVEYSKITETDELCETFKEIKITPRSHKHIKAIMGNFNNEDDTVQVYLAGGSIEEADITNTDYIVLNSDNSKFYYAPKRGQNRSKDLKIILRDFCQHNCIVSYNNTKYCEECYRKCVKDAPRISLLN